MKKILLPVDGSKASVKAYKYAKDFAQKFEAEIIIFNAQDLTPPFGWLYDPVISKNDENNPQKVSEEIVSKAKEAFADTDIKVTTLVSVGDPATTILDTAEKEGCDIIIMCTHGMSMSKRFLLGSVTNKVVHHAKIPVLVVR